MDRKEEFLADAVSHAKQGSEVRISIRLLLGYWYAERRGYRVVDQIERDLTKVGLTTSPPFTEGWIDNTVSLTLVKREERGLEVESATSAEIVESTDRLPEVSLTIGSLPSANQGITAVSPNDTLERAQALMMRHDYSQLAVMSGERSLHGAVSWESIAQARIRDSSAGLDKAIAVAETVRREDDLLALIPRIIDAGFVFVQSSDRKISGIVTTADLSFQFSSLASPFFLLAEVERRVRRIIDAAFQLDEIRAVLDPADGGRPVASADDLSVGEYVRLFEKPESWARLKWALDRVEFVKALQQVRVIRNEVMHFSPDPLEDSQISQLRNFLKWLRRLGPEPPVL